MLPLVPLNTVFTLTEDWTFQLHYEHRNTDFASNCRRRWQKPKNYRDDPEPLSMTLPVGTKLTLKRIYIRQGGDLYDSVSFWCNKGAKTGPRGRFWVKLQDTYHMKVGVPDVVRLTNAKALKPEDVLQAAKDAVKKHYDTVLTHLRQHGIFGLSADRLGVVKQVSRKDGTFAWGLRTHWTAFFAVVVITSEDGSTIERVIIVNGEGRSRINTKGFLTLTLKGLDKYKLAEEILTP